MHKSVPCSRMTIAKNVLILAVCVQMNVEKWRQCSQVALSELNSPWDVVILVIITAYQGVLSFTPRFEVKIKLIKNAELEKPKSYK